MRDGGAANILIGFIPLDQQRDVAPRVFAGKGHHRPTIALGQWNLGQAVALPSGHQASNLRPAVATGMLQVPEQHATFALATSRVVKPLENPADVPVPFAVVPGRRKLDGCAGAKKLFDLFNRANPLFVHVDHPPLDDQPTYPSPSASSLQGNQPASTVIEFTC